MAVSTGTHISEKIRYDYGTIARFCRIHKLNQNTFRTVLHGYGTSSPIAKILVDEGYIQSSDDLKRKSA